MKILPELIIKKVLLILNKVAKMVDITDKNMNKFYLRKMQIVYKYGVPVRLHKFSRRDSLDEYGIEFNVFGQSLHNRFFIDCDDVKNSDLSLIEDFFNVSNEVAIDMVMNAKVIKPTCDSDFEKIKNDFIYKLIFSYKNARDINDCFNKIISVLKYMY